MANLDIAIDVVCGECGASLDCNQSSSRSGFTVEVSPCEKCMNEAEERGRESPKDFGEVM